MVSWNTDGFTAADNTWSSSSAKAVFRVSRARAIDRNPGEHALAPQITDPCEDRQRRRVTWQHRAPDQLEQKGAGRVTPAALVPGEDFVAHPPKAEARR